MEPWRHREFTAYLFFSMVAVALNLLAIILSISRPLPSTCPAMEMHSKSTSFVLSIVMSLWISINCSIEACCQYITLRRVHDHETLNHSMLLLRSNCFINFFTAIGFVIGDIFLLVASKELIARANMIAFVINFQQVALMTFTHLSLEIFTSNGSPIWKYFYPVICNALWTTAVLLQMGTYFFESHLIFTVLSLILHGVSALWMLIATGHFIKSIFQQEEEMSVDQKSSFIFLLGYQFFWFFIWAIFFSYGGQNWCEMGVGQICIYYYVIAAALFFTDYFPRNIAVLALFQREGALRSKTALMRNIANEVEWPQALLWRAILDIKIVQGMLGRDDRMRDEQLETDLGGLHLACVASLRFLANLGMCGKFESSSFVFQKATVTLEHVLEQFRHTATTQMGMTGVRLMSIHFALGEGTGNGTGPVHESIASAGTVSRASAVFMSADADAVVFLLFNLIHELLIDTISDVDSAGREDGKDRDVWLQSAPCNLHCELIVDDEAVTGDSSATRTQTRAQAQAQSEGQEQSRGTSQAQASTSPLSSTLQSPSPSSNMSFVDLRSRSIGSNSGGGASNRSSSTLIDDFNDEEYDEDDAFRADADQWNDAPPGGPLVAAEAAARRLQKEMLPMLGLRSRKRRRRHYVRFHVEGPASPEASPLLHTDVKGSRPQECKVGEGDLTLLGSSADSHEMEIREDEESTLSMRTRAPRLTGGASHISPGGNGDGDGVGGAEESSRESTAHEFAASSPVPSSSPSRKSFLAQTVIQSIIAGHDGRMGINPFGATFVDLPVRVHVSVAQSHNNQHNCNDSDEPWGTDLDMQLEGEDEYGIDIRLYDRLPPSDVRKIFAMDSVSEDSCSRIDMISDLSETI